MAEAEQVASCVAPGRQPVLFHVPSGRVPTYSVIDRDGVERVRTTALGAAMTAARHLVVEQGQAWVRSSDDTTAHIDPTRVASDTPSCPWITTVATTLEEHP